MNRKEQEKSIPSACTNYLIKNGMDEAIAMEIGEYTKRKEKRRKRIKDRKEDKWR